MSFVRAIFIVLAISRLCAQSTVVVSGRITDAFTGLLVEGAAITLTQGVDASRQIRFADAGGNYSFDEAMAGEGSVEIEASGFLAFGRANPEDAAIKIATDHAQHNFKLTPAATISGRITLEQEDGKQVVSASLLHEDFTDGIRRFIGIANVEGVTFTTTSPVELNGTFQFTGLPPGRYIIGVGPRIGGCLSWAASDTTRNTESPTIPGQPSSRTHSPSRSRRARPRWQISNW